MKKIKKIFALLLLALVMGSALMQAQDVKFTADAPSVVEMGEQFRLVYTLNNKANGFSAPEIDGFAVLMGPSTSYNSSTQVINGKRTKRVSYSYTYILQAVKEGKFNISPATVSINGKNYSSNQLSIEVVKGGKASSPARVQSNTGSSATEKGGSDLFVRLLVDRKNIYRGDKVTASIKIYSRVNLSGFEDFKIPDFAGFIKEDIETPPLKSLERENVNGEIYGTGVLSRFVLYPQKSGELVIDPVEISALVQQRVRQSSGGFFDDFFDSYQNVRRQIESTPVKINVKPLPAGAPASFSGAVGSYKISASLDKQQVKSNEAVSLKVRISGKGNLKYVQAPGIDFPHDLELYDPKINTSTKASVSGITGSKSFEYLMIPRFAGDYTIPPIKFSYFDPAAGKYKTLSTSAFNIEVLKGDEEEGLTMISSPTKEDIKFIGKDIRFIDTGDVRFCPKDTTIWHRLWFILLFPLSLILFLILYLLRRKMRRERADLVLARNRHANKLAKKRLKKASDWLKSENDAGFYEEILKALWGYLGDKLGIPSSELSRDNIAGKLQEYGVSKDIIQELSLLLDTCEYAQYAPSGEKMGLKEVYANAVDIIVKLEHKLR